MNYKLFIFNTLLAVFTSTITICAQENTRSVDEVHTTSSNHSNRKVDPTNEVPDYFRHHRRLSGTYTGLVIELIQSDRPLPRNHELFTQFGEIFFDHLQGDDDHVGGYSYCIKTAYTSQKKLRKFLAMMVLPRVPTARIIVYKNGERTIM